MINYNSHTRINKDASIQLDSLRGFSALLVLVAHIVQVFINPLNLVLETPSQIFSQLAVMMFFVLSGFLIGKSITRNCNQNTTLQFKSYIRDRANRILPPFFFSIILVVILYFLAPVFFPSGTNLYLNNSDSLARLGFEMDIQSTIGSIFFLNGFITETMPANGPLWSLSYEVWYYVLAGLLVLSSNRLCALLAITLLFILSFLDIKFLLHSVIWFTGFLLCLIHNQEYKISHQRIKLFNLFWLALSTLFAFLYVFKKHNLIRPLS